MRKQLFLVAMTLLSVLSLNAQTFAGGEGTAEKPYEIATAEQMKELINTAVPDQTTYFKMTADVNTIIENCYFTGSVDAPACRVGGIVGKSENRYGSVVKGNIVAASSINGIADITGLVIGNCPDAYYEKGLVTNNYASSYTKLLYAGAEVTPAPNGNGQESNSHHGTITDNVINAAKTIGWDSKVWDLTGPEPELILTASDDVKPRTEGTESNPYLISSAEDLKAMISQVVEDETVHFKMTADVDMAGVENWVPFNQNSPFKNRVVFDGDGHTIKNLTCKNQTYSSFAGVLYGEIKNVAFVDATIENTTGSHCGVVAGYLGTGGIYGEINNVYVNGKVTNDNAGVHAGGVTGYFKYGSIKNCYVDVNVTSATSDDKGVGGIAGYQYDGKNLKESTPDVNTIIENCYFVGSVNAPDAHVGGILGKSENRYGNWVNGNITNAVSLNGAANGGGSTQTVGLIMGRCYADYYAKGCVLDNYASANTKVLVAGEEVTVAPGENGIQNDSYHGTVTSENLANVAKTLGWDGSCWDLSNEVPILKLFNMTTGISNIRPAKTDGYYYNISGQRVKDNCKGILIKNGKKFIVK